MVTRPLTFDGKQLAMNYSTSAAGSFRVGPMAGALPESLFPPARWD
jgi:hypothetical protein